MKKCGKIKLVTKVLSMLLTIFIVASILPALPVNAATQTIAEYNKEVSDKADEIGAKYNIIITYPIRTDGYAAVGVPSLLVLDQSLSYVSADFVRQLSDYYEKNYSGKINIDFTYLPDEHENFDNIKLGKFNSKTSKIDLYIPTTSKDMTISGCSPLTILHEIGHAYYVVVMNTYGADNFKGKWLGFNNNLTYGTYTQSQLNKTIFASLYGATTLEEDFAEVFAYAFGCNRTGLGIKQYIYTDNYTYTGLGKKIDYLKQSISKMFVGSKNIIKGIDITCKAKPSINYNGLTLSGNSLEYIDFYQPYGVIDNILQKLKITSVSLNWVSEVGGWKVWDNAGGIYIVFPGAEYATIQRPIKSVK